MLAGQIFNVIARKMCYHYHACCSEQL